MERREEMRNLLIPIAIIIAGALIAAAVYLRPCKTEYEACVQGLKAMGHPTYSDIAEVACAEGARR